MTDEFEPDALTKKIYGRGVRRATAPAMTVMWTTTYVPCQSDIFRPNHSMVLYRHRKQTQHNIDLTSTLAASGPPPAQSDRSLTPTSNISIDTQHVINAEGGYDLLNKDQFLDCAHFQHMEMIGKRDHENMLEPNKTRLALCMRARARACVRVGMGLVLVCI